MITTFAVLALISGEAAISAVVWLVGLSLVFWLLWCIVGYAAMPEPFNKVVRVILALAAVVVLINVILSIVGHPIFRY